MESESNIGYHLRELEIALNPHMVEHVMPEFIASDHAVLDIGCGIGQTLIASGFDHGKLLVGIDCDIECLIYGHRHYENIIYVHGTAEKLPFQDATFDLILSKVTLPYTNIPRALVEIGRTLRKDGRVWFTLHPFSMAISHLLSSMRTYRIKDSVYRCYVIVSGLMLNAIGWQFPFVSRNKFESFQTVAGMRKIMERAGFVDVTVENVGRHLICSARKAT